MNSRLLLLLLALTAGSARAASVMQSVHDLSATGPGAIKATAEKDACVFCHTAHGSTPKMPLWNRQNSGAVYKPYTSTTVKAVIGQPTGSSRMCLSCHDGTIALGLVNSSAKPLAMKNNVQQMPSGMANLGVDLSGDHPISFIFDSHLASADAGLKDPSTLSGRVRLDENHQMQCTSCHDPHDNRYGNFLVADNSGAALCAACHNLNSWSGSAHNTSAARWNGQGKNPWPQTDRQTVAANACENCHTPHKAGVKQRLLTAATIEDDCYVCHSGSVATENIRAEFRKTSVHPVDLTSSVHDAAEDPINGPRHASCVDCHNPHASKPGAAAAPFASGSIADVKGMNASGGTMTTISRQYELCFRCNADSPKRAAASVPRQKPETNKRLQFSLSNGSYHPVEGPGKNSRVPSLISPMTTATMIFCTDCHNSDSGPGAGGNGPRGPHGSIYPPLLERQQVLTDYSPESAASYALCYKCHSRSSILGDQSFKGHSKHIIDYKTACTTCHDSHGVASGASLINFNTVYVAPAPGGNITYVRTGPGSANCTLSCHGSVHRNSSYDVPATLQRRSLTKGF